MDLTAEEIQIYYEDDVSIDVKWSVRGGGRRVGVDNEYFLETNYTFSLFSFKFH